MRSQRFQPLSFDYGDQEMSGQNQSGNFLQNYLKNIFSQNQNQSQNQNVNPELTNEDYFRKILSEKYNQPYEPSPNKKFGEGSSLMDLLRQRESGGNYGAQNSLGYSGAYQFGAQALEDLGYLKPGTSKQGNKALNNPENWTIQGGKEAFLNNKELQDEAFRKFTSLNERKLRNLGIVNENTDPQQLNAYLAAAHLAGPGGVQRLVRGQDRRDAYGTPASEYYKLGMKAKSIS